jgi:uncharacterized protein
MRVFERPGPVNTDEIVNIVREKSNLVKHIVVASITGESAIKIANIVSNKNIACVTCPQGMYWETDQMDKDIFNDIPELKEIRDKWIREGLHRVPMNITYENRAILNELNVSIVQGTIPFFGPSFSLRLHLHQVTSLDIIAKTLELISPGTLVCLESVLMSTDAGVIPEGELVLACAGTERGLDTAWIMRSCASANLFHPLRGFRFVELLAKPGIALQPDINIEYLR